MKGYLSHLCPMPRFPHPQQRSSVKPNIVPGDPVIVGGVTALKEQLIAANATINVARAVVLTNPRAWMETTYMAPVGIPLTQGPTDEQQLTDQAMKDGITIAMIVVPSGAKDPVAGLDLGPGAYLLREFVVQGDSKQWIVRFIGSDGETKGQVAETEEPLKFDSKILLGLPSAGIFIGSNKCYHCHWWGCHKGSC